MINNNFKDKTIQKVIKTIDVNKMLSSGDSILISFSGGPDSTFLVHLFQTIKELYALKLYCFHLDHKTRNGSSKEDAVFVEEFCSRHNLKLFKEEIDAQKWCSERKLSFQEGSRILRKQLLENISEEAGIGKIATGHNADDSIETFFINLLRGSGSKGLASIKPFEGRIIRPLIETRRNEIESYLKANKIRYCIDCTNRQDIYLRNKIRNKLLPFIKKEFSGSFEENLLNTIKILREENDFLTALSKDTLEKISSFKTGQQNGSSLSSKKNNKTLKKNEDHSSAIEIPLCKLKDIPKAFLKRIIFAAIEKLQGSMAGIKSSSIDKIAAFCFTGGESREVFLGGGLRAKKEHDRLFIYYCSGEDLPAAGKKPSYVFEVLKEKKLKDFNLRIKSSIIEANEAYLKDRQISESEAYLDFDKISFPVTIKSWEKNSGQSFFPFGMKKPKKLHDFFIDAKVPAGKRDKVAVFSDSEKIIWISGYRIDERVRVDKKTKKILYIKIFPN